MTVAELISLVEQELASCEALIADRFDREVSLVIDELQVMRERLLELGGS